MIVSKITYKAYNITPNVINISAILNIKLPAGTYYIKIGKDVKKTNGNYQIKIVAK